MGPAQIARPDRDNAFPLQLLQGFKGFGQFFFGTCYHCCPDVKGLGVCAAERKELGLIGI